MKHLNILFSVILLAGFTCSDVFSASKKGKGTLSKWFSSRGFGFIREVSEYGINREIFVHASRVRPDSADPIVGVDATFTVILGPKGFNAFDVKFQPKTEITDAMISTLSTAVPSEEIFDGGAL